MRKHHPYQNIIEDKLDQLPTANADLLWNEMHSILDKKMPQEKNRRRFILWFLMSNGVLLLFIGLLIIGSAVFFLSTKENSTVVAKKSKNSLPSDNFIEEGTARISPEPKQNLPIAAKPIQKGNEKNQKGSNNITTAPFNSVDHLITNNFIA